MEAAEAATLSGNIRIDGSSTVQPFAEAAAELFNEENPDVNVTVGGAGTGDGFEKFCRGETQISDASRAIEEDETKLCKQGKVKPVEVQVANDGITVVTNKNLKVDCITTGQLKKIFGKGAKVTNLSDAGGNLPDAELALFTPGTESGTFDFFTEQINGEEGVQRTEGIQTSADDNVLVTGVSGEDGGFGYFGYSFYEQNQDKLNAVRRRRRQRLRQAERRDDPERRVQAPLPSAVHVPERGRAEEARGEGLHGLRGGELRRDRRGGEDRPDERAAGHGGEVAPSAASPARPDQMEASSPTTAAPAGP